MVSRTINHRGAEAQRTTNRWPVFAKAERGALQRCVSVSLWFSSGLAA
jgi:hypothetical protein